MNLISQLFRPSTFVFLSLPVGSQSFFFRQLYEIYSLVWQFCHSKPFYRLCVQLNRKENNKNMHWITKHKNSLLQYSRIIIKEPSSIHLLVQVTALNEYGFCDLSHFCSAEEKCSTRPLQDQTGMMYGNRAPHGYAWRFMDRLIDRLIDWLTDWLTDWLIDWLNIGRMIDRLIDWLIDWLAKYHIFFLLRCCHRCTEIVGESSQTWAALPVTHREDFDSALRLIPRIMMNDWADGGALNDPGVCLRALKGHCRPPPWNHPVSALKSHFPCSGCHGMRNWPYYVWRSWISFPIFAWASWLHFFLPRYLWTLDLLVDKNKYVILRSFDWLIDW